MPPSNPQTRFFEAQLAYQKKDFKPARELAQQLLQQAPNNPRVLQLAGRRRIAAGRARPRREIYLAKALQLAPELRAGAAPADRDLPALGPAGQGVDRPERRRRQGRHRPRRCTRWRARCYLQNGDAKKAEEYFAKALKLDPDDAQQAHRAGGHPPGRRQGRGGLRRVAEHRRDRQRHHGRPGADQRAPARARSSTRRWPPSTSSRPSSPTSRWRPTCAAAC